MPIICPVPSNARTANVGARLAAIATEMPDAIAVVVPRGRDADGRRRYDRFTFRELDEDSNRIASGLAASGVPRGARLVLMVRPGFDFVSLVFGLLKGAYVAVLIDPGMGRTHLLRCLAESQPDGFVAVPLAHAVRSWCRRRFPGAKHLVTVGRRWWWGGITLHEVRRRGDPQTFADSVDARDAAAVIFTTGSTGPPKGVLYQHSHFNGQVDALRDYYGIRKGEIDLPGFPLFALFNSAMGVTTVIPDMDATRPARVDPRKIIEAARDWQVTQAFGSPAMWNTVGRYCERRGERLESVRRVFSAGAPVPPHVLLRMRDAIHAEGEIHTPYGATEALPVASIASSALLNETAPQTRDGRGYCVGNRFPELDWKIIAIRDDSIARLDEAIALPQGEIGELIVRGPVVTREYVTRRESNALHKITDGETVWHRMGDVGYLDPMDRFWFCGRKSHRVRTRSGVLFTIPCEAIANRHPAVYRSALVGIGPPGDQVPAIVAEPWPEHWPSRRRGRRVLVEEIRRELEQHPLTSAIRHVFLMRRLPVDIRHNAKIFREQLAAWASRRFGMRREARG
ncbi:MAG: AMP-binding protein [Planctomycetes bacterium]|nr:AMP-binding protein [Planctomycetota bacterium]